MSTIADSLLSLFNSNKHSDVIQTSQHASLNTPLDPYASRIVAASYFKLGEYHSADRILSDLENVFHNDPEFLSLIGTNCRRLGDLSRASSYFKQALLLEPSIFVRNNYANLLIDLQKYLDARDLLQQILIESPDYGDAKANLNRVENLIKESHPQVSPTGVVGNSSDFDFLDPLLVAFEPDEVTYAHQRYGKKKSSRELSNFNFDQDLPKPSNRSIALEQVSLIPHFLQHKRWQSVLKICSSTQLVIGPDSRIYEYASDAYLNLKYYREAEVCLLQAIALGEITLKRALNMVSFCLMRNDYQLAEYYIQQATNLDSSSTTITKFRAMLDSKRTSYDVSNSFSFPLSWPA